jgi:hypothetical protein
MALAFYGRVRYNLLTPFLALAENWASRGKASPKCCREIDGPISGGTLPANFTGRRRA